jgi:hypothetical protein
LEILPKALDLSVGNSQVSQPFIRPASPNKFSGQFVYLTARFSKYVTICLAELVSVFCDLLPNVRQPCLLLEGAGCLFSQRSIDPPASTSPTSIPCSRLPVFDLFDRYLGQLDVLLELLGSRLRPFYSLFQSADTR